MGSTFDTLVTLASATLRGLAVMALAMPELAAVRPAMKPFGATDRRPWALPALGVGSIAVAFLEPDPSVRWDAQRLADLRAALARPELVQS